MAYDEITAATQGIRSWLDTLASINAENILIPGGPQEQYHQIVEEAYVALGLIETQVDELRAELEYQHKRLDRLRDAALSARDLPTVPHLEPPVQVVRVCLSITYRILIHTLLSNVAVIVLL